MPVQQKQRPIAQNQAPQQPCQNRRPRCGFGGFMRRKFCGSRCGPAQTSNSNVDQKTKWATFRVNTLSKKLGCCTCLFSCFSFAFFITSIVTFFSARFNAQHIAQTGHLPWVSPQIDFIPSEQPAKYEFGLYDNFLKMGMLQMCLSVTFSMFAMRTMIAKFLKREKNSNIAFRRTFYCIFAFFLFYGLLFREQGKLQNVYPQIAEEMNVTAPVQQPRPDFGGRFLQSQGLDMEMPEIFKKVQAQIKKRFENMNTEVEQPQEEQEEAEPKKQEEMPQQQEHHQRRHHRNGRHHGKHHRHHPRNEEGEMEDSEQRPPCWRRFEDELRRQEEESRFEQVGGMCPLCFLFIMFCAFAQLCLLKKHARACKRLQALKEWQAAEKAADQADIEAQQEYQAVINSSVVETDRSGEFDYSIEEPNPEDKAGSDVIFQVSTGDKHVKVNANTGSVVVSNNMV